MHRRHLIALALVSGAPLPAAAATPGSSDVPAHIATFWRDGDAGERLEIRGQVMTPELTPVAGAQVSVRQADGTGEYTGAYSGTMITNARGEYVLRTAMPGNYGVPKHIHLTVSHPDLGYAYTEIRFKGDPLLPPEDVERAIALETVRLGDRQHKVGTFDIVLERH